MTTKPSPPACASCAATDAPLTVVETVGGANSVLACPACAEELFIPAGFVIA